MSQTRWVTAAVIAGLIAGGARAQAPSSTYASLPTPPGEMKIQEYGEGYQDSPHLIAGQAQTPAEGAPGAGGGAEGGANAGGDLSQQANDPSAPLGSLNVAAWYYNKPQLSAVVLRPVIPFELFGFQHISRFTLPYYTDGPLGRSGIGDLTALDLVVFKAPWGRWGAGVVASIPTGINPALGNRLLSVGPSSLVIVNATEKLTVGILSQNLFSIAGPRDVTGVGLEPIFLPDNVVLQPILNTGRRPPVESSVVQPFLNYNLGGGWNVGSSELTFTYDWQASRWSSLPLGAKLSKLVKSKATPIMMTGMVTYNFADGAPRWLYQAQVGFLFP